MRKIFLDVGCHYGETLDEVIKKKHNFDKIYAFEPSIENFNILQKYNSDIVSIHNIGLSNIEEVVNLYDAGSGGASIYSDKCDLDNPNKIEKITLIKASEWIIQNLDLNDIIYLKLNCEGSECDIIDDLLDNNIYDRINHVMIDFDVRKIPSQQNRENEILYKLKDKKNWNRCENVMIGNTHQEKIQNWLSKC